MRVLLCSEVGYTSEQFARVSNSFVSLLSHDDADHRLNAATHLGSLRRETKPIDLALLHSFVSDSRVGR